MNYAFAYFSAAGCLGSTVSFRGRMQTAGRNLSESRDRRKLLVC